MAEGGKPVNRAPAKICELGVAGEHPVNPRPPSLRVNGSARSGPMTGYAKQSRYVSPPVSRKLLRRAARSSQ